MVKAIHEQSLKDISQKLFNFACSYKAETNQEVAPVVFLKVSGVSKMIVIPFTPNSPNQKAEFMWNIGKMLAKQNMIPERVILISEAYMLKSKKPPKNYKQGDLANDPKSDEVIMLQSRDLVGNGYMFTKNIKTGKVQITDCKKDDTTTEGITDLIFNPNPQNES